MKSIVSVLLMLTAVLILMQAACRGAAKPQDSHPPAGTPAVSQTLPPRATSTQSLALPTLQPPASPTPPATVSSLLPTITPSATAEPPATATRLAAPITFAVIGDYGGTGQGTQDVAALVRSWDPDLVLTLGDNNYPDGEAHTLEANITQHYGSFINEGRFFPSLGNHDMTTDNGTPYLEYFDLPGNERYYDFVRGEIHFFALNSDWREPDGIRADSRQAQWLQERLAGSTAPWQVVYFHVPPYVSMVAKEVPVLRWPFAAWRADLVLSGHAHLYERLLVDGIPYVVNGLGGTVIYPIDDQPHSASQIRYNDDFGALLVEGTAGQLRLQFVTRAGLLVDSLLLDAAN